MLMWRKIRRKKKMCLTAVGIIIFIILRYNLDNGDDSLNAKHNSKHRKQLSIHKLESKNELEKKNKTAEVLPKKILNVQPPVKAYNNSGVNKNKNGTVVKKKLQNILQYMIKPNADVCRTNGTKLSVVIFIPSETRNFVRRQAIRESWGSVMNSHTWPINITIHKHFSIIFVTALQSARLNDRLLSESKIHGDILQVNFNEDYRNLTLKSLVMLKYAMENCKHVPFIVKSDDDNFVHVRFLFYTLFKKNNTDFRRGIIGHCYKEGGEVLRKTKWHVPVDHFPYPVFPRYISGNIYIINTDIIEEMYNTSRFIPLVPIEDAYITGILAKLTDARHVCLNGIFPRIADRAPNPCDVKMSKKIAFTRCSDKRQKLVWSLLHQSINCKTNVENKNNIKSP